MFDATDAAYAAEIIKRATAMPKHVPRIEENIDPASVHYGDFDRPPARFQYQPWEKKGPPGFWGSLGQAAKGMGSQMLAPVRAVTGIGLPNNNSGMLYRGGMAGAGQWAVGKATGDQAMANEGAQRFMRPSTWTKPLHVARNQDQKYFTPIFDWAYREIPSYMQHPVQGLKNWARQPWGDID